MSRPAREHGNRRVLTESGATAGVTGLAARITKAGKAIDASAGDPIDCLEPLRQMAKALDDLRDAIPLFRAHLEGVERAARESLLRLESDLRDRCSKLGWQIDGHWPAFWIQRGISIEIDENSASATVSQVRVAASAEAIVRTLASMVENLIPPRFSPSEFVTKLANAYDSSRTPSRQVQILDLYRNFVIGSQRPRFWANAVAKDFFELSINQFRAQLSACLEQGRVVTSDQRELRLSPPIDPKDGLFVYQPTERRFGFIGYVEFVGA